MLCQRARPDVPHESPHTNLTTNTAPRKTVKIRYVRRMVAEWDFEKDFDKQDTHTIDLGLELLLPHKVGCSWKYEGERALEVYGALRSFIFTVLTKCGCRNFECTGRNFIAYFNKPGARKPKIPDWLDIPYIIIKQGEDVWGNLELH